MLTRPQPLPLDDLGEAIRIIAKVTNAPIETVVGRLREEHACMGANVSRAMQAAGVRPYVPGRELDDFYQRTDAFLYESFVWNRCREKQSLRSRVIDALDRFGRPRSRVLVYGDGLGFDCAAVAMAGHAVTYHDVGVASRGFADDVFAQNGVAVETVDTLCDEAAEAFDAIVCLDVLEHVVDPPAMVAALAERLAPGGLFIAHAPFAFVAPTVPTHLASNVRYSGDWRRVYGHAGLIPVDGHLLWNPIVLKKAAAAGADTFPWRRRLPWLLGGAFLRLSAYWSTPYSLLCGMNAAAQCAELSRRTRWPEWCSASAD